MESTILKAIVDAADAAANPIEAAIGTDNNGADFVGKENVKSAVESAVGEVSGWLEEMIKAAGEAAAGSTGGGEKIGDTGADGQKGKKADASSVTGIAKGIKGIVDAAGKAITGKPGGVLAGVTAAAKDNKEAGKLFAGSKGNAAVDAAAIGKAAAAVSAVSGEQILKAIVDAAIVLNCR
ncbi:variable large family protein (plasmid) [Borreliella finlandensis]|uniref:variable large family protein n=1 Tax=Borreliella finlandensis TaxID=498741 RepID=UPI003AF165A6